MEKSTDSRTSTGSPTRIDMPLPKAAAAKAIIALRKIKVFDCLDDPEFISDSFNSDDGQIATGGGLTRYHFV